MSDNSSSATQRKVKLKPIVVTDEMFMADPIDVLRFQSDLPCMEFPVFSLKTGVKKTINYKFDDTDMACHQLMIKIFGSIAFQN